MSNYPLTWITNHLAVGHAPMSYDELDSIKAQGIGAIINLCAEFTDLHEIEASQGFEVFYLPIPDEHAPPMAVMEGALEWLDESIYLGKKVLVHCRHGIGRTGTFVTAYLVRRGFSLKQAGKMMKPTRANPTNFPQWWLLRKFGKKEGRLTVQEPTPENRKADNLEPFFKRYEQLLEKLDNTDNDASSCCDSGSGDSTVRKNCSGIVELELIEALYLQNKVNITLSNEKRREVIDRTAAANNPLNHDRAPAGPDQRPERCAGSSCPLFQGAACLLHQFRPVSCRMTRQTFADMIKDDIRHELKQLSREIFAAVFNLTIDHPPPPVQIADAVSGRFIQKYFQFLATQKKVSNQ